MFVRELCEHPGLTRIHSELRRGLGRNTQFPVSDLHRVKSGRCGETQVGADGPCEGSRIVAAGGLQDMDSSESSVLGCSNRAFTTYFKSTSYHPLFLIQPSTR